MSLLNISATYHAAAASNPTTAIGEGRVVRITPSGAAAGRVARTTVETQLPAGIAAFMDDENGGSVTVVRGGPTAALFGGVVQPGAAVMSDADGACVAAVGPCWVVGYHHGIVDTADGVEAEIIVNPFYTDAVGSV